MPSEPLLSVRGEATLEVEPEVARVEVTVMARDKARGRALELLAERSAHVLARIKGYGDAVEKLESGAVTVYPEFKDGKPRERIAGYVARSVVQVTVGDFGVLGELVPTLANEEMVAVAGPSWLLRPDSPVYRQARLAAAKDATGRAREYAEAFGGTITGLVEAADSGLLTEQSRHPVMLGEARRLTSVSAQAGLVEFDFEPAKQTVRAQIEARFTMTAPSFGTG